MSDLQTTLTSYGINLDQNALDRFGAAAADFQNQQTLSQQVGSASSSLSSLSSTSSSSSSAKPNIESSMTKGDWQSTRYASDLVNYAPKHRFIFKVKFIFNDPYSSAINREFMYVVKEVDKPKVTFEYEDINMYNFKTKVLKAIKHEPLNISFHDDIQNKVSDFFIQYRQAYSPSSNLMPSQSKTMEQGGMSFTTPGTTSGSYSASMGLLAGGNVNILSYIEIVQVYAHGTRQTTYTFTNPRIESFDFDNLTHESSEGNGMTCQFSYDALYVKDSTVSGTPEYSWGQTDIIGGTDGSSVAAQIGSVIGDSTSTGKSQTYTFNATDSIVTGLGGVKSAFPSLGTDVVSSAGAGTGQSYDALTQSFMTQNLHGVNNTFGFDIGNSTATQAAQGAVDNLPSASDIFDF